MPNPERGEATVSLGGVRYVLRFSWHTLAVMGDELGAGWRHRCNPDADEFDVRVLAAVIEHGTDHAIEADEVLRMSPPIVETSAAIYQALGLAYFGPDGQPAENGADDDSERPINRKARRAAKRGGQHTEQAASLPNSGA